METTEASQPAPPTPSSLRHKLRATVCCCFGYSDRAQWGRRRRAGGVGEFRYDPLSYALNFDEGPDDHDDDDVDYEDFSDGGLLYRSFSSPPPPPQSTRARTSSMPPPAVAVA